jgi:regulator of protease activity HflC (stomatin/prohibitin superfamily)
MLLQVTAVNPASALSLNERVLVLEKTVFTKDDAVKMSNEMKKEAAEKRAEDKKEAAEKRAEDKREAAEMRAVDKKELAEMRIENKRDMVLFFSLSLVTPLLTFLRLLIMDAKIELEKSKKKTIQDDFLTLLKYLKIK